jgi:hypothetical protein
VFAADKEYKTMFCIYWGVYYLPRKTLEAYYYIVVYDIASIYYLGL